MKFGLATTFLALAAAPSLVQGENLYCDESVSTRFRNVSFTSTFGRLHPTRWWSYRKIRTEESYQSLTCIPSSDT